MHYLYRYVCILNVFFICVYGQLSAIKNLLLLLSIESILTQFRNINMWCQNVIFPKTKDGAQPRKFLKNCTI